ncbi:MAG: hypothetical protein IPO60_09840 [Flavobacteriales bacterium]|nr:hypothetical protein [Flavobacteriales bacterium]MBK7247296.1 hypothetical protein [Flavobacteriales bacterium]MBK7285947.1 hypothetical protein [Flavobacteriales bacterium]MBK9598592.1 hypothetical protein [Flavobacteriales bacterium]HQY04149.1 hypothetical protein [Flavobacteriales bacterium]
MPITEIDRIRIHGDLEQLGELVSRKQALWQGTNDQAAKAELETEMAGHMELMNQLKAQL